LYSSPSSKIVRRTGHEARMGDITQVKLSL